MYRSMTLALPALLVAVGLAMPVEAAISGTPGSTVVLQETSPNTFTYLDHYDWDSDPGTPAAAGTWAADTWSYTDVTQVVASRLLLDSNTSIIDYRILVPFDISELDGDVTVNIQARRGTTLRVGDTAGTITDHLLFESTSSWNGDFEEPDGGAGASFVVPLAALDTSTSDEFVFYVRVQNEGGGGTAETHLFGAKASQVIPEPASLALLASGVMLMGIRRVKKS